MWDLGFSQYTPSRPTLFGLGPWIGRWPLNSISSDTMLKFKGLQEAKALKSRYFKMDDVPYPLRILPRYVSGEYPNIKFYFLIK
ncbi:hypothetical protein MTR_7g047020 [Medicago truncatula]|uniref:Uncharacterized protein n=1 Tax=Medicago truncatula TaxID=3880 RepID=G7KUZ5_MEDTR|nr:hypothetical protein MTR_7g047020 [Medicago truncatula]